MDTPRAFTPVDLAAWQRRELGGEDDLRVELPALQRGSAWKPYQTELLWDSLLRGFPVGSILLARYDPSRGRRKGEAQDDSKREPNFHLLDGQQRWNSIARGFVDIWRPGESGLQDAVWIDLDPEELPDGRLFLFRCVTRSHPWGYKRKDPSQRLTAGERRSAFAEFEKAARAANLWQQDFRPGSFPPSLAWPWDAVAPVPVSHLIEAIRSAKDDESRWRNLEITLSRLPYWAEHEREPTRIAEWRDRVRKLIWKRTSHMDEIMRASHMDKIMRGMAINLGLTKDAPYRIPALIAPDDATLRSAGNAQDREDPLATLFVRVNVAGTRPSDDELRFSMLKSVCPEVQDIAERLGGRWMSPAKLVTMLSRLVLARGAPEPPGEPDLARFRRLIHGQDEKCSDFL
jgi:hypothetical protein